MTQNILSYALSNDCKIGFSSGTFPGNSYTEELPDEGIKYGTWEITKRSQNTITIKVFSPYKSTMWVNSYVNTAGWNGWKQMVVNTDLPTRIKPIEVNGYSGQTFKSVLKDKCDNSINFVVFRSNASNPITDNPFSFVNGYAIVFNSIALAPSNSLMILGTSDGNNAVIESRRLDLR